MNNMNMDPNALPSHHYITTPPPPPYTVAYDGNTHVPHKPSFTHMAFYWSKNTEFLFPGWPDHKSGMYALGLIFVFVLAVLVEFLSNINVVKSGSNRAAGCFFQMGINSIRAGFHYMVILAVTSYNGGVFIAAVVGHAVGYLIFGSPIFKKNTDK